MNVSSYLSSKFKQYFEGILNNTITSSTQANIQSLLDDAYEARVNNIEQSIALAEKALDLSRKEKDQTFIGKSLAKLALFHMIIGDFELSINMANEASDIFEKLGDREGVASAKYAIAGSLYKTDDYKLGLYYLIDCLAVYKELGDYHNQARVEKSMGTIYENFGDVESAIKIYEASIRSAEKANDKNLQSNAFNPLSGIYLNKGDLAKAKELIERSISFKEESGDIRGLAFALYGRGKIHSATGNFEQAEADFVACEKIHIEMREKYGLAMSFQKRGELYIKMETLDKAEETLIKALEYSHKNRISLIVFKSNYALHKVAQQKGDFKLALKYLQQYIEEKENVIDDRTAKVIESYEVINKMNKLEQDAKVQKEKAEIIEKKKVELDSFFYRISHDLKGPITSMKSLNYLAKYEVQDENSLKFFEHYESLANRLNTILDGLLKLTKMSFSDDEKQDIDFEKIIYECINSYKFLTNFELVKFNVEVDQEIEYKASWALVNTILQNLIENGIKYARTEENEPQIAISVLSTGSHIEILAKDNGIGMDEKTVSKIFTMFFRVNRKIEGTGLGLHILKRAVERLEGNVSVDSNLGEGTTFKIILPV